MDKKDALLLFFGISLYSIGFYFFLSISGRVSEMIGGILLGIFLVRIGEKIRIKRKVLGSVLRGFGITFTGLAILLIGTSFILIK